MSCKPAAEQAAGAVLHRVLLLKERLSSTTQEPRKIAKALKELQETNISLDILVETGIGKAVNSFRKHADFGDLAKSLVSQWKQLVPQEKQSDPKEKLYVKNGLSSSSAVKQNTPIEKKKILENPAKGHKKSSTLEESKPRNNVESKHAAKDPVLKRSFNSKDCKNSDTKKNPQTGSVSSKGNLKDCNGKQSRSENLGSSSTSTRKESFNQKEIIKEPNKDVLKTKKSNAVENSKQNDSPKSSEKLADEEFEAPTMSFESYLNYDQASSKRKKKNHPTNEKYKKVKTEQLSKIPERNKTNEEKKSKQDLSDTLTKKGKIENLTDLLDIPLPKFLPDYSILPSPTYEMDKEPVPEALSEEYNDMNCFTGKRLNSKMQVYSGSKPIFLSKMLSLYEQCLRVLQNNIDLLHEVGGVPFEILEPVLERCTPEQLNRIEEYNPSFVEESDHLWKKHCQKDFRNEHLLEYESWREMYLRLFSEREEKLQKLTKDISSAHSGKPKGRQVKLAYVHCVAKPPRSIRRRQEIFGTAGPIAQPHPIDRLKVQKIEKEKVNSSDCPSSSSSNAPVIEIPQNIAPALEVKRQFKRVAPMMAKTIRAFKNRVGPR
ncbi:elongin-A-like isoform X2 [Ambystoma mexicanum]|uniref:elongin-A-like isoform X2 n=1 Tax=Ambystoma mexicanum TaxID=8296 RepID=UPI0037E84C47